MAQPEPADSDLTNLLVHRDGQRTLVDLRDGRRLSVINIAWGHDLGDEYAHVATNVSPSIEGERVGLFFTSEVVAIQDEPGPRVVVATAGSKPTCVVAC